MSRIRLAAGAALALALAGEAGAQGVPPGAGASPAAAPPRINKALRGRAAPGAAPPLNGREGISLSFATTPRVLAKVTWGKKLLGTTPFQLRWPRESGPIDVQVTAEGYVPVRTRLYTFNDDRVHVKLTPVADKKSLFGYKRELPPPAAPVGVPGGGPGAVAPPGAPGAVAPPGTAPPAGQPGAAPAPMPGALPGTTPVPVPVPPQGTPPRPPG